MVVQSNPPTLPKDRCTVTDTQLKDWTGLHYPKRNKTRRGLHCRMSYFKHASCKTFGPLCALAYLGRFLKQSKQGTGAVLLVGGALNMRDADGHGTTHLYPSVNGQLWSLQTILASVTALVVHEITGPGDEHAALGRLISRGAASLMLLIHIMWLYFRYGSHRNLFDHDTTDENTIDEMRHREIRTSSQQLSQGVLSWRSLHLLSWLFVLVCPVLGTATAMNLVTTTEGLAQTVHLSKNAVTLTLLPLVGIVPTMVETLKAAAKNHMDLAARLTLESSVDITYVALPTLILVAWVNDKPMSMNFGYFEVIELCVSAWLIGRIFSSGRSTYLDGATLLSLYVNFCANGMLER